MSRQRIRFANAGRPSGGKRRSGSAGNPAQTALPKTAVEVQIESFSLEGRGVARVDGKTLFVSGALPGERVQAQIEAQHKRYDEARCVQVLDAAAERQTPFCAHYGRCGGCELQHLVPAAQIDYKQQQLLDQLQRFAGIAPTQVEPALTGPEQGYRRSARVGINQRADGQLLLGFRRRASNKLLDIDHCPVLEQRIDALLQALRAVLDGRSDIKALTHAEISAGDDSLALTLRLTRRPASDLRQALLTACEALQAQLWFEYNDAQLERITPATEALSYSVDQPPLRLQFAPGDFLQVNAAINQQMIARALDWLAPQPNERALDLFCGLGNFTLPLARRVKQAVGVEGSAEMVERASQNAALNGLDNVSFYKSDLSADIRETPWYRSSRQQGFDLILLDPPRAGAAEAISQLVNYGARAILYVSCNPAALVRDAKTLTENGYTLSRFCVMDMFPHTAHVESLALFTRTR